MVFVNFPYVVLLPVFLNAFISLTSTTVAGKSITSHHGPLDITQPQLMRHFSKDSPVIGQWAMTMLGDEPIRIADDVPPMYRGLGGLAKRSSSTNGGAEQGDVPLGIGVLSNMAKFFGQLRGNLDSVEEVGHMNHVVDPDQASANTILEMLNNNRAMGVAPEPVDPENLDVLPAQVRRIISGRGVAPRRNKAYSYTGLGK